VNTSIGHRNRGSLKEPGGDLRLGLDAEWLIGNGLSRRPLPCAIALDPQASQRRRKQAGVLLIECLVYVALFMVITGLATAAFYRALDNSRRLRRNVGDIALALEAGERWRAEVRSATAPLRLVTEAAQQTLHIPRGADEIVYAFAEGTLRRRATAGAVWTKALANLKSSQMTREERNGVVSWRWEIEFKSQLKETRVRPLFSFLAVAAADQKR